tara:strand:+ start:13366 stop:13587 length:222 start_codon:yes stop_codon:yes gene_type:complete
MTDKREPYWNYMGRRLREVRDNTFLTREDLCKKEIAEMQKQVHILQLRVKELKEIVDRQSKTIKSLLPSISQD